MRGNGRYAGDTRMTQAIEFAGLAARPKRVRIGHCSRAGYLSQIFGPGAGRVALPA